MPRPMEEMITQPALLTPSPRHILILTLLAIIRHSIIAVKRLRRLLHEPLRAVPGHILQNEFRAEVVEQEVVFAGVHVHRDTAVIED